jgi:GTPase
MQCGVGTATGRCYAGRLRVGDLFTLVEAPDGTRREVELLVTRIEAYRTDFDAIDEGLTARLTMRGHGWEGLEEGSVLSTLEPSAGS